METKLTGWQRRDDLFIVPRGGWLLVSVILLSVFLAGGKPLWAHGAICLGIGLLWIFKTPTGAPSKLSGLVLAVLAVIPLTAYLPAEWFVLPTWRAGLAKFPNITPSLLISPQPWLTFHVYLLWLSGLALALWCASQDWDHFHRGTMARMYAGGMLAITLFAVFGVLTGYQPSWWISTDGFGPFINRNQWGSAMGFAGIVSVALVHQCIRQQYKQGVIFWALAAAVFAGGIIYNGSRGGVIVLIGGGFAYWGLYGLVKKQYQYAAIGISFLLIAFAMFALGGGPLLERFVDLKKMAGDGFSEDMRVQFFRMTTTMIAASPLMGFGLGNFEYVFPFYLDFEPLFDRRPIHPESSWLWLASEGGWLLLVAVAVAVAVLIWQSFTARKSRGATVRAAGLACAAMLACNSGFDVSGHRLGTLFPVIMLASLALPPVGSEKVSFVQAGISKLIGAVLVFCGLIWILGAFGTPAFPAAQGIAALQQRAQTAMKNGQSAEAVAILEGCEKLRPLDWGVHWTLSDWLLAEGKLDPAWREFQASNALLPYHFWTVKEGAEKWMIPSPGRAASAILETIQKSPEAKRPEIYAGFLRKSTDNPRLKTLLLKLFPDKPAFELERIRQAATPEASAQLLKRLVEKTDGLSTASDQVAPNVLRLMLERDQLAEIDAILAENPRLKRIAWDVVYEREVRGKRFSEALDIYFSFGPRPAIPASLNRSDLRSVERAAAIAPLDVPTSIAYYQALLAAHRDKDAAWQLHRVMELPNAPAYIWFLAAKSAHESGNDEEALALLRGYQSRAKP